MLAEFTNLESHAAEISRSSPTAPLEPTSIDLHTDSVTDSPLGRVGAPSAVAADLVEVSNPPSCAQPGKAYTFPLSLHSAYVAGGPEDIAVAVASLAQHAHVEVLLKPPSSASAFLNVSYSTDASKRCAIVSVEIPHGAPRLSEIVVTRISIGGRAVTLGHTLPLRAIVSRGLTPNILLRAPGFNLYTLLTPAVSGDGTLYVPQYRSSTVLVFGYDGRTLPPISLAPLGISTSMTIVAGICDSTRTLLLCDENKTDSVIVAIDAETRSLRWSTPRDTTGCRGLAVLSQQGVVVAGCHGESTLRVYRISDGALLATSTKLPGRPVNATADPSSGIVYVSLGQVVHAYSWDGTALQAHGMLAESAPGRNYRALAVFPPSAGRGISYLVIGTWGDPDVIVLKLPHGRLVAKCGLSDRGRTVRKFNVKGLAADALGRNLVVCDDGGTVHVLPWPLEGMPLLE
jgi:hypothetical protein